MKDFYYILGLEPDCTLDEVKEAYRKLSKKLHPDLNQGDKYFEDRFRDIQEAWETLRDPVKRSQYDQALRKIRSNPVEEQVFTKQQRENQRSSDANPATAAVSKRKGPGVGMTITIILIALILGDYLVRTFNPPKKIVTIQRLSAGVAIAVKTRTHHKKKHNVKNKSTTARVKVNEANKVPEPDEAFLPVKQVVLKDNKQPAAGNIKKAAVIVKSPMPVFSVKRTVAAQSDNSDLPVNSSYTTYIKANPTGVVNMRASDNYGAAIIQTIPADAKVIVIAKGDLYYRVSYSRVVGYVPKWSLKTK